MADVTFTGANDVAVASTQGDSLTISDGTHSNTFYRVASGASAANGTYSSAANLVSAIASSANSIHSTITGTAVGTTGITLTAANNVGITVGGNIGPALGFGTSAVTNNVNTTLAGLTGTLTVQVGAERPTRSRSAAATARSAPRPGSRQRSRLHRHHRLDQQLARHQLQPDELRQRHGRRHRVDPDCAWSERGYDHAGSNRRNAQCDPHQPAGQYNALLTQIDQLAKDSSYNGINLLYGDNLKVTFNEKRLRAR